MYRRTRPLRVGSDDYTAVLRFTLQAPQVERSGGLVDRTVQTVAVSYPITIPETVAAGVGGELLISVPNGRTRRIRKTINGRRDRRSQVTPDRGGEAAQCR